MRRRAAMARGAGAIVPGDDTRSVRTQPQLKLMHIDWWTLALQTINVLILIWLLAHFLFRPVSEIMARRQEEANKLLADAEATRQAAEGERADLARTRAGIATERQEAIAAAHAAAEADRAALLAHTNDDLAKLRNDASVAISRDRAAMEKALIDHASDLAADIARRLLSRVGPDAAIDSFLPGFCEQLKALAPQEHAVFARGAGEEDGEDAEKKVENVEIVTATPLGAGVAERIRQAVTSALDPQSVLVFRSDPAVIAGVELHSRHAVVCNSWRNDLERICKELNGGADEPARPRR